MTINSIRQMTKADALDALDKHHAGERERMAETHRRERNHLLEWFESKTISTSD